MATRGSLAEVPGLIEGDEGLELFDVQEKHRQEVTRSQ